MRCNIVARLFDTITYIHLYCPRFVGRMEGSIIEPRKSTRKRKQSVRAFEAAQMLATKKAKTNNPKSHVQLRKPVTRRRVQLRKPVNRRPVQSRKPVNKPQSPDDLQEFNEWMGACARRSINQSRTALIASVVPAPWVCLFAEACQPHADGQRAARATAHLV
jgi:hypothetical protein